MDVKKIVSQSKFAQVGFVVNDIEKAKKQFALLFGCEIPPTCDCGTFDVTQTQIYGKPAPDAACVMAFFDMTPGVQLELIQPNEEPSVWRDYLNTYGEGIHHIAFQVDDADEVAKRLQEEMGATFEQEGNYGDGSGKYIYLLCEETLKCRLELLQSLISNQLVCFVPINECLLSIVVYVRSCAVSFLHKIFFLNVFMEL